MLENINNANDLLTRDHREVEQAYELFKNTTGEERKEHADHILTALTVHAALEEELYYPELEKVGEKDLADEFRAEHQTVKMQIGKLKLMSIESEEYEPTLKAMMESVLHHVHEEESEAMPRMEQILGKSKLEELLPEMIERKEELENSTLKQFMASIS